MKYVCTLLKQDGKNYVHIDDSDIYYQNLEHTFKHIENDIQAEFLNFAFVTLCSSTLEASLNHIIFTYFINEFGPVEYKKYTDSFINLSFANKLHSTPILVTKSEFYFNSDSSTIKILEELITLRNRLLHQKPILREFEHDIEELEEGMEVKVKSNNYIKSITKKQCVNFNKAILCFKKEFMEPFVEKELKETKLLRKR